MDECQTKERTAYPLLNDLTTERKKAQRGTKRSGVSSKNIFRSYSL